MSDSDYRSRLLGAGARMTMQRRFHNNLLCAIVCFPLLGASAARAADVPVKAPRVVTLSSDLLTADVEPGRDQNAISVAAGSAAGSSGSQLAPTDAAPSLPPVPGRSPESEPKNESASTALGIWGVDVSKHNASTWIGALIDPSGDLDKSGVRFWFYGEAGTYKYFDSGTSFQGNFQTGDVLVGYGFEGETYSINLLAGVNVINHDVSPFDPANAAQGTKAGLKIRGDIYWTPTARTMTYGEYEYSTAFRTYWVSQRLGFDVTDGRKIYFGPHVMLFGDQWDRQWRLGGHVSNVRFGKVEVDFSAGYSHDRAVGSGAYGYLETSVNF